MPPGAAMLGGLSEHIYGSGLSQSALNALNNPPLRIQPGQVWSAQPSQGSTKPKEEGAMNYVKEYFIKHRELIMGLAIVMLLDHYIFKDAFKEKLQTIVQGLLDKTQKKLEEA